MNIVGLTGGIGSGKTIISKMFATMNVPVYYADDEARKIITDDKEVVAEIKKIFGDGVYLSGQYNTQLVRDVIFKDPEKLYALNAIVHPAVLRHSQEWAKEHEHFAYTLREAAVLFESGADKMCTAVINVNAPVEVRILRVMTRDGVQENYVRSIIEKQWTDEMRSEKSTFNILNDGLQPLLPQVLAVDAALRNKN